MFLLAADIHLTDKSADRERFKLFPWLAKKQLEHDTWATFILGDITDSKDKHSAWLVNSVVEGLLKLRPPVYIQKGNHDYIDPNNPFFGFLDKLEGIYFISTAELIRGQSKCLVIPHMRDEAEWTTCIKTFKGMTDYAFIHQTVEGVISESGARLDGFSTKPLEYIKAKRVFAGDIHRSQTIGPVTYVGSPYNIRFGENSEPRCLLVDDATGKAKTLRINLPRKVSVKIKEADDLKRFNLSEGDQVKITIELAREEAVEWKTHKQQALDMCVKLGLKSHGVDLKVMNKKRVRLDQDKVQSASKSYTEILLDFSKQENLASQVKQAGLKLLEE